MVWKGGMWLGKRDDVDLEGSQGKGNDIGEGG